MYSSAIGLTIGGVMNIILDPIFIFVFHMDVAGAAVATMLSNAISMVYFFVVLAKMRKSTVLTLSPKYFSLEKKVPCSLCLTFGGGGLPSCPNPLHDI